MINVRRRIENYPSEELHSVPVPSSSWKQIRIDYIGPLPTTTCTNGNKYVIVVIDCFSMWLKHEAMCISKKRSQ